MTIDNMKEPSTPPSIMNIALKWGLISTAVSIVVFVIRAITSGNPFDNNWVWTLVVTAISIALLVLAQREFKTEGDGFMTYGQGFKVGFMVSLISVVAYGIFVLVYTTVIDTNVMEAMLQAQREKMESQGTPDEQIEMAISMTSKFFWPIFFVGGVIGSAIVVLIVTIFTQRNNPNPSF